MSRKQVDDQLNKKKVNEYIESSRPDLAKPVIKKICKRNRQDAEAWFLLGVTNQLLGLNRDAVQAYGNAIKYNKSYFQAYLNKGTLYHNMGDIAAAIRSYKKALSINCKCLDARQYLGLALHQQGKYNDAIEVFRKLIEKHPGNADAYNNLGNALRLSGRVSDSLSQYRHAIEISPDFAGAHWNYSMACLLLGLFSEGWEEYEWRWACGGATQREFSSPVWDGSRQPGKTILVHAEQGIGDALQFVRYVPLVKRMVARVIVECHPEIARLLHTCEGVSKVIARDEDIPAHDFHVPLMSLPRLFNTNIDNIPADIPYLRAPDTHHRELDNIFTNISNRRCVGITWAGSPAHVNDMNRSCSLDLFRPISELDNVDLISLQKGDAAEVLRGLKPDMRIIDIQDSLNDFADTAYAIMQLDIIISVDTSVAHLAGALGKTVWLLLPYSPDWRWLLHRNHSPWYPTMRLFRQDSIGDWEGVFATISDELERII